MTTSVEIAVSVTETADGLWIAVATSDDVRFAHFDSMPTGRVCIVGEGMADAVGRLSTKIVKAIANATIDHNIGAPSMITHHEITLHVYIPDDGPCAVVAEGDVIKEPDVNIGRTVNRLFRFDERPHRALMTVASRLAEIVVADQLERISIRARLAAELPEPTPREVWQQLVQDKIDAGYHGRDISVAGYPPQDEE